jgi:hypothetical protein
MKQLFLGLAIGFIYALGMLSGAYVYKSNHPITQPKVLKVYDVVAVDSLNSAWYKYTLIDQTSAIFDSVQVCLPERFVLGYDKVYLTW